MLNMEGKVDEFAVDNCVMCTVWAKVKARPVSSLAKSMTSYHLIYPGGSLTEETA